MKYPVVDVIVSNIDVFIREDQLDQFLDELDRLLCDFSINDDYVFTYTVEDSNVLVDDDLVVYEKED